MKVREQTPMYMVLNCCYSFMPIFDIAWRCCYNVFAIMMHLYQVKILVLIYILTLILYIL